ncbi:MAG: hypothetical protein M5U34_33905 [Chloroflexi bacterium]|nr:hypothetical protein [Chloroflexota bacterium]
MLTQLPLVMAPQEYQSHPPPPRRRICDLPAEERPLYRLHQCGSNGLSTTELLSLLLGTAEAPGLAQDLLDHFDSLHGLARASQAQLLRIHGIGEAQAARRRLVQLLRQENGRPVLASTVIYQVQLGAYGRGFYSNDLTPVLQSIVAETFQAHGYCPTPEDGEYRPCPSRLPQRQPVTSPRNWPR